MCSKPRNTLRVGILSASLGCIPDSFRMPTAAALDAAAGRNTGNLAFRHAVARHIESEKVHVPWATDPEWVRERCDLLVIPSANQAHPTMDFANRADFIEAVNLPCLALGLGAQATTLEAELTLPPGTLRYLHALAERSRLIGVRGEFTAGVLAKIGIKNTVVIGCPSNFINPAAHLGAMIEQKLHRGSFKRLVVTAGDLRPAHREVERKLFRWLLARRGVYVCQSNVSLVSLARNRLRELDRGQVDEIRRYLQPGPTRLRPRAKFLEMARARFRVLFDVGTWLELLTYFDLSIGTRLHGNLLAVQAETPGVCIYHDARTQELCATTAIPHVSVKKFLSARRLRTVIEMTSFDGSAFDKRRIVHARTYRQLLADSGVDVSDALDRLAEP